MQNANPMTNTWSERSTASNGSLACGSSRPRRGSRSPTPARASRGTATTSDQPSAISASTHTGHRFSAVKRRIVPPTLPPVIARGESWAS